MMAQTITPTARSIFLCDYHFSSEKYKDDLYGICNAIRVEKFPFRQPRLCIFAILSNGLGRTPFHFDISDAQTGELIRVTLTDFIMFPHRRKNVRVVMSLENFIFPRAGLYLFDLYCNNTWVADTTLEVISVVGKGGDDEE